MNSPLKSSAADSLIDLPNLDRKGLALCWSKVFGCPAPKGTQAPFLRSALAWHYQIILEADCEAEQFIRRLRRQLTAAAPTEVLTPGTRLLREWHGTTHHVTVTPDGFDYAGKTYRSLTAIARDITGTAWSGPSFFGLTK